MNGMEVEGGLPFNQIVLKMIESFYVGQHFRVYAMD